MRAMVRAGNSLLHLAPQLVTATNLEIWSQQMCLTNTIATATGNTNATQTGIYTNTNTDRNTGMNKYYKYQDCVQLQLHANTYKQTNKQTHMYTQQNTYILLFMMI